VQAVLRIVKSKPIIEEQSGSQMSIFSTVSGDDDGALIGARGISIDNENGALD
jgi:hypothetical protein